MTIITMTMILTLAAISDVKKGVIPNLIIWCSVAIGGATAIWQNRLEGIFTYVLDFLLAFLPLFICYMLRTLGAGDVKLISAIWAWLGTGQDRLMILWFSFLVASVMSFFAVMMKSRNVDRCKTSVRLGPAFLLGWLIYLGGLNFV